MLKKYSAFNLGFFFLMLVHLLSVTESLAFKLDIEDLRWMTKPLIVLSLLGLLVYRSKLRGRFIKRIGLGLLFGLFGDVFLLLPGEVFFLAGLGSFLIGHVFYIMAFMLDFRNTEVTSSATSVLAGGGVLFFGSYGAWFMKWLFPSLGSLWPAVLVYILVIAAMGVMALLRWEKVNGSSFLMITAGAILFIASDSILAANRFKIEIPYASVYIMATYILAQYLITIGSLERKRKKRFTENRRQRLSEQSVEDL